MFISWTGIQENMMETVRAHQEVELHHHHSQVRTGDHHKVPLWIGTERKLVSGVKKSTTCQDVIRSLIHPPDDPSKFVIVEKWRKVSWNGVLLNMFKL